MRIVVSLVLALAACAPELNPARKPRPDALAGGGVWVAYNLGCDQGCAEIRRGDRILAIEGRPVSSGAEIDALNLARGEPRQLLVVPYGTTETREVTLVARPRDDLPPLTGVPPLFTVGAAALDRAPEWARDKLFGHAIPAIRFYRADEPRGYINGRELYGRAALVVVWEHPPKIEEQRRSYELVPSVYAHLQDHADELQAAGVDPYFVTDFRAEPAFRTHARSRVGAEQQALLPIFQLTSSPNDPNTLGLEGAAADIREGLYDYTRAPVILVIDRRGIVRFHARGFPLGPQDSLAAAIHFALASLTDAPSPA